MEGFFAVITAKELSLLFLTDETIFYVNIALILDIVFEHDVLFQLTFGSGLPTFGFFDVKVKAFIQILLFLA